MKPVLKMSAVRNYLTNIRSSFGTGQKCSYKNYSCQVYQKWRFDDTEVSMGDMTHDRAWELAQQLSSESLFFIFNDVLRIPFCELGYLWNCWHIRMLIEKQRYKSTPTGVKTAAPSFRFSLVHLFYFQFAEVKGILWVRNTILRLSHGLCTNEVKHAGGPLPLLKGGDSWLRDLGWLWTTWSPNWPVAATIRITAF